jgi:hypothetical protein
VQIEFPFKQKSKCTEVDGHLEICPNMYIYISNESNCKKHKHTHRMLELFKPSHHNGIHSELGMTHHNAVAILATNAVREMTYILMKHIYSKYSK